MITKTDNLNGESIRRKRGASGGVFLGWLFVLIFLANLSLGTSFFFTGAPFSFGDMYSSPPKPPDLSVFPYKFSAAYPYPPVVLNFAETTEPGEDASYEWTRLNYISQLERRTIDSGAELGGIPSIGQITDSASLRPGEMRKLAGKPHDDPVIFEILNRRLAYLDNGWIAEIVVGERALNLYKPEKPPYAPPIESIPEGEEYSPEFVPRLDAGAEPDISHSLSRSLNGGEYPLAISTGKSVPLLIAGSRGTLLKLDESGRTIERTRLSGDWTPVGGIIFGTTLVGIDVVLTIRRIIAIIFFAAPLLAYLSFAYAADRAGKAID